MIQDTQNNQKVEKMTIEDLTVIVTQGFLSMDKKIDNLDEKFVTNERFERSMMAIAQTFNQVQGAIADLQKSVGFLIQEIVAMREENREFRQRTSQLERTDIIHERKIDELDTRVLKLETAA